MNRLGEYKYKVLDAFDPALNIVDEGKPDPHKLPRLIYYDTTMQTVNAVVCCSLLRARDAVIATPTPATQLSAVEAKIVDPTKCCAVFQDAQVCSKRGSAHKSVVYDPHCTCIHIPGHRRAHDASSTD